jgi:predicted aspartyl protease
VLIDTGASVSVIKPGIMAAEIWSTQTEARGITGGKLKVMGTQLVSLNVGNRIFTHEFLVSSLDTEYSGILGVDILRHMGARVDLRTSTLLIGKKRHQLSGQTDGEGEGTRHQWHQRQVASEPGLANPTETSSLGQAEMPLSGSNSKGMTNDCWDVVAFESVILPPHAEGLVIGRLKGYKGEKLPGEV